jgi:hypothetical protein
LAWSGWQLLGCQPAGHCLHSGAPGRFHCRGGFVGGSPTASHFSCLAKKSNQKKSLTGRSSSVCSLPLIDCFICFGLPGRLRAVQSRLSREAGLSSGRPLREILKNRFIRVHAEGTLESGDFFIRLLRFGTTLCRSDSAALWFANQASQRCAVRIRRLYGSKIRLANTVPFGFGSSMIRRSGRAGLYRSDSIARWSDTIRPDGTKLIQTVEKI